MLILSRRVGEKLMIGDPKTGQVIEVVVTAINHGNVKLGISCPKEIKILRAELLKGAKDDECGKETR